MTQSTILRSTLLALLLTCAALAADFTGKWTGQTAGQDGSGMTITFNLKQDGAKLTGSVEVMPGQPMEIADGKVDGDKISFTTSFDMGGGAMKILNQGTLKGEEITMVSKMEGGGMDLGGPITLKRAK